ncbi:hypothetical protein [Paenibacillus oleatilyticus]|uniref:hypothetical protein n=1 Tax=Paenibacillus oleatilyticus TaxID=2594886 RepID=UPI001C1FE7BD|nr:hypothetical protein [Paenibacillus oleatilyticus]MBU7314184.1 hypothetical protein [Paenibacillus oleatilyticus]
MKASTPTMACKFILYKSFGFVYKNHIIYTLFGVYIHFIKFAVPILLSLSLSFVVFSQSAFAYVGIGDFQDKTELSFPGEMYSWPLQTAADKDWFYWTNNTGSRKAIKALFPFSHYCNAAITLNKKSG